MQHLSLAHSDDLPSGVIPVSKESFIDVLAQLTEQTVPEKFEGLAIGPRLADGSYAILLGTDNDYSVTQTGAGEQFDICVDATERAASRYPSIRTRRSRADLGFLMSFKGTVEAYQPVRHPREGRRC